MKGWMDDGEMDVWIAHWWITEKGWTDGWTDNR